MAKVYGEAIQKWIDDLALALQLYIENNGIKSRAVLSRQLGIPEREFQRIVVGEKISYRQIELYAEIFYQLGIEEADPRRIPNVEIFDEERELTQRIPVAWSDTQYRSWVDSKSPNGINDQMIQVESEAVPQPQNLHAVPEKGLSKTEVAQQKAVELEFANRFLDAVDRWLQGNWPGSTEKFCKSIGVRGHWLADIKHSQNVSENTEVYAKIFLRTWLPESDPRLLPDKLKFLPKAGYHLKKISWDDQEYANWLAEQERLEAAESPDTPILSGSGQTADSSDKVEEQAAVDEAPSSISVELPEPVITTDEEVFSAPPGDSIRSQNLLPAEAIDQSLDAFKVFLQELVHKIATPPPSSGGLNKPAADSLETLSKRLDDVETVFQAIHRLELKIDNIAQHLHRSVTPSADASPQAGPLGKVSITALMNELSRRLEDSRQMTVTDRDKLAKIVAPLAGGLIPYLSAYAQSSSQKREEVLSSIVEWRIS